MAKKHFIVPQIPLPRVTAVRLGSGNTDSTRLSISDVGKFVKLVGESRYDLAAIGDKIEGVIVQVEAATSDGYAIGGVARGVVGDSFIFAYADGAQADGTGALAVNDLVVVGTPVAKGTVQEGFPRVRKATSQTPGTFSWRVVSLGEAGSGAAGTKIVIERI